MKTSFQLDTAACNTGIASFLRTPLPVATLFGPPVNGQGVQNGLPSGKPKTLRRDTQGGTVCLMGQPFHRSTMEEALTDCEDAIHDRRCRHFVTVNMDFVTQAQGDSRLRKLLFNADRVLCDGQPLVWFSKLLRDPLPERVAGSDLVPALLERCARKGHSVFFFGSDEKTLTKLRSEVATRFPGLRIAGAISPPMASIDSWDNDQYVRTIREARPDVLLVALGFPKQDVWIDRFRASLKVPLSIGIGASLDFIAGKQKRAPRWMQRCGLEWSWRLLSDPRRLLGRYARNFMALATLTMKHTLSLLRKGHSAAARRSLSSLPGDVASIFAPGLDSFPAAPASANAIVCDCSELAGSDQRTLGWLAETSRLCRQRGQAFVLFNAPRALTGYIRAFHLERELPSFFSPLALRAWISVAAAASAKPEFTCRLSAPACVQGNATRFLTESVAELDRVLPEGARITVDLHRTSRIDSRVGGELAKLKGRLTKCGRSLNVAMLPGTVRDTLKLLRLHSFLSESLVNSNSAEATPRTSFPGRHELAIPLPDTNATAPIALSA